MTGLADVSDGAGRWRPDALRPPRADGHRRGAGQRHRRAARPLQRLAVPPDPRARRARHPAMPGRDRRRGARLCRKLPLSASSRRRRPIAADAAAAPARQGAAAAERRAWRRHARPRLGGDRGGDLGRVAARIHGAVRPVAAQPEGRIAARGQARKPGGHRPLRGNPRHPRPRLRRTGAGRSQPRARLQGDAARQIPARDGRGARARAGGVQEERHRLSRNRHAGEHHDRRSTRACASSPATARKPPASAAPISSGRCRFSFAGFSSLVRSFEQDVAASARCG